jgi:hypothetical protein
MAVVMPVQPLTERGRRDVASLSGKLFPSEKGGVKMREAISTVQSSNFGLKNELVELIPSAGAATHVSLGVRDLEAMRTSAAFVPASKHGLETICGASCETGAQ